MKTEKTLSNLFLLDSEGWNLTNLQSAAHSPFYQYAFENNEFCMAWVTVVKRIKKSDLLQNCFKRDNPFEKGLNLYRPYFLIITDGKVWNISSIANTEFREVKLKDLRQEMIVVLKQYLGWMRERAIANDHVLKIKRSVMVLMRALKAESDPTVGSGQTELFDIDAACENVGPDSDIDDSYKGMHKVAIMRNDILEKMLSSKYAEATDLSKMVHHLLCTGFNQIQLSRLLNMSDKFTYVNPWYNSNELLVKILDFDLYDKNSKAKKMNNEFIILESSGDFRALEIERANAADQLQPGLFKLNKDYVRHYLKNANHG